MGFHMDQLILFGDGLCRFLVQTGLLIRVHVLFEEAEREFLRLFRETSPLRLLPEEHLRISGQCLLGAEETLLEGGVLGLQGVHLFLFFSSHVYPFFLYASYEKTGIYARKKTTFF